MMFVIGHVAQFVYDEGKVVLVFSVMEEHLNRLCGEILLFELNFPIFHLLYIEHGYHAIEEAADGWGVGVHFFAQANVSSDVWFHRFHNNH